MESIYRELPFPTGSLVDFSKEELPHLWSRKYLKLYKLCDMSNSDTECSFTLSLENVIMVNFYNH